MIALFPQDACGILRTLDGKKLSFEYSAFNGGDLSRLDIGDRLVFIEEPDGAGSRASSVRVSHRVKPVAAGAA